MMYTYSCKAVQSRKERIGERVGRAWLGPALSTTGPWTEYGMAWERLQTMHAGTLSTRRDAVRINSWDRAPSVGTPRRPRHVLRKVPRLACPRYLM